MARKPTASLPEAGSPGESAFDGVVARLTGAASRLPGIAVATSYGTPAIKAGGKLLMRVRDADTAVLMCPLEEKELLLESAPAIYYETDHYRGWPALLVRLGAISDEELRLRMENAFRFKAPRKLAREWEEGT
jgi:hypothetical protein